jgi:hypothetical protein
MDRCLLYEQTIFITYPLSSCACEQSPCLGKKCRSDMMRYMEYNRLSVKVIRSAEGVKVF